jgi:hypothetical protein
MVRRILVLTADLNKIRRTNLVPPWYIPWYVPSCKRALTYIKLLESAQTKYYSASEMGLEGISHIKESFRFFRKI